SLLPDRTTPDAAGPMPETGRPTEPARPPAARLDPEADESRPTSAPVSSTEPSTTSPPADDHGPDAPKDAPEPGPLQPVAAVLGPSLRTHRAALITGGIALLLSVWMLIALPFPLKYALDAAVASTGADLPALAGITDPAGTLTISVIVLGALLIAQVATRFTALAALGRVGTRIATALRTRLLGHLHSLTPQADGPSTAEMGRTGPTAAARRDGPTERDEVRPLIDDVASLRDLLSHAGPRVAAGALTLLSLLIVTVIVAPLAALVLVVTGAVQTLIATLVLRRRRAARQAARSETRLLAETADELVAATGTIQSYGLESRAERGLAEAGARDGRALTRARRTDSLLQLATQVIGGAGVLATLLLGGTRVAAGTMTPGDVVLVLADLLIMILVLHELLEHTGALRSAPAAGRRIAELLDRRAGITEPERTQGVDRVGGEIVFSAVDTASGAGGPLFETVSVVVPRGQHVALLDGSGAEAAALISYLLRFDQPDTGRVLLDRFDTRTLSLSDLRRQIAVVQREPVLFTDTVRENIRVGRPEASDAEVEQAARRAGVDDVIARLEAGFDTVLRRRGDVLTDGQRRRVAIARALLRDAPIVVLDAADADLSAAERRPVLAALATLGQGRTAIVSSRDPETIAALDRVLWFEDGQVLEDGAPSALATDQGSRLARWLRSQDEGV
ncbi:MAG: ATP-binding cassette domain-containing protein, partial [Brachybacterium sp.]|uniref:ABC transporter ATP-binding protein n=1 Tax=Brachybacterium sp. TaxID=1891286 RepID=UPI0026497291